jgi:hypothetical protein
MEKILKISLAALLTGVVGSALVRHSAEIRTNVVERDSIAYWTAGRLLTEGQNPYDAERVLDLERNQGYRADKPLVLRTPPWSLFLVMPLGSLSPLGAWVAWTSISLASLLTGMRICWKLYGARSIPQNLFSLIGYTFAPVPACLVAGQMGLVLLVGVVLFLWWEKERPFLAGVMLLIPFAKPHLLALFWFGLIVWLIVCKKVRVAFGFSIAVAAAIVFPLALDPGVFRHYNEMLHRAAISYEFIPALSGVLRLLFFRRFFWIQFVPLALGLVWAMWFLLRHRNDWDWRAHGPALLIASVLTTPYAWLTDEVVVLPAILQAAVFVYQSRQEMKITSRLVLLIFVLLDALLLMILRFKIPFATGVYFWSSVLWFSWYVYGHRWHSRFLGLRKESVAT